MLKQFLISTLAVFALVLASAPATSRAQQPIEEFVRQEMAAKHIAGLSAALVKNGRVVWAEGFGLADVRLNKPVTTDTLFMTASLCKTLTATGLMHAWEQGLYGLDDDINGYLSFLVENPSHPGVPITFRQVLTHTSSIKDNWGLLDPFYVPGDWKTPLDYWCENYLSPGGKWYFANQNYYSHAPGAKYRYANQGFALAGHLVEAVNGSVSFEQYTDTNLFSPLGMDKTEWHFRNVDPGEVAIPYMWNAGQNTWKPFTGMGVHYGYPDYPAGTLRTTPTELAQFLIMHMNGGTYHGQQIISQATADEMHKIQFPSINGSQAIGFYTMNWQGQKCIGHDGGDPGLWTEMWWRLSDDVGVIVFANTEKPLDNIVNALFDEAASY